MHGIFSFSRKRATVDHASFCVALHRTCSGRFFGLNFPYHLPGNSSFASYFPLNILADETPPPPRNFQWPSLGWVWIFSGTAHYTYIGDSRAAFLMFLGKIVTVLLIRYTWLCWLKGKFKIIIIIITLDLDITLNMTTLSQRWLKPNLNPNVLLKHSTSGKKWFSKNINNYYIIIYLHNQIVIFINRTEYYLLRKLWSEQKILV